MRIDANTLATLVVVACSVLGWLYTQLQATARRQRTELRWFRKMHGGRTRYIFRLEEELRERGIALPDKPKELVDAEKEEDGW